jgi:serine/threonine protein kinase
MYLSLVGKHPIHAKGDTKKEYSRKLRNLSDLTLPASLKVSDNCRDFFEKLCKLHPSKRYDAQKALKHPFLTGNDEDPIPLTTSEEINQVQAENLLRQA